MQTLIILEWQIAISRERLSVTGSATVTAALKEAVFSFPAAIRYRRSIVSCGTNAATPAGSIFTKTYLAASKNLSSLSMASESICLSSWR